MAGSGEGLTSKVKDFAPGNRPPYPGVAQLFTNKACEALTPHFLGKELSGETNTGNNLDQVLGDLGLPSALSGLGLSSIKATMGESGSMAPWRVRRGEGGQTLNLSPFLP